MTYLRRQRHELQLTTGWTQRQAAKMSARLVDTVEAAGERTASTGRL